MTNNTAIKTGLGSACIEDAPRWEAAVCLSQQFVKAYVGLRSIIRNEALQKHEFE